MILPENRKNKTDSGAKKLNNDKTPVITKKDVDEFDLSTEDFTNNINESDGEDF